MPLSSEKETGSGAQKKEMALVGKHGKFIYDNRVPESRYQCIEVLVESMEGWSLPMSFSQ